MSSFTSIWNSDYNEWSGSSSSSQEHENIVNAYNADSTNYYSNVLANFDAFCKTHCPEQAFLYFLTIVVGSINPDNHSNILGLYQDQLAGYGASMKVAADTTTLTNDLQNLFNGQYSSQDSGSDVQSAYNDVTTMINAFTPPSQGGTDPAVYNSFDPDQASSILQQLQGIQSNLITYFDPSVLTGGTGTLMSFAQMNTEMGEKSDPDHAVEAAQGFTNANQTLTADFQNVNASLNQQVSLITGTITDIQSFQTAIMTDFINEVNTANQNMTAGG